MKAIREGNVNLRDSYASLDGAEVWIYNVHINPYSHRGYADHEPTRKRKLLLHRQEIKKLIGRTVERGMTLVPVRLYFKDGRVKVELGLGRGRKKGDKRQAMAERDSKREIARAMVRKAKGTD